MGYETYGRILMPAYPVLRTPAQATAPSGRTRSPKIQYVRGFVEFENHLWYISARYHAMLRGLSLVKVNASLLEVTKLAHA